MMMTTPSIVRYCLLIALLCPTGVPEQAVVDLIEIPKDLAHGDLAIPVPKFNKFKKLTEKPNDLAVKLAAAFQPNELIEGAKPTGPFVNFRINKSIQTAKVPPLRPHQRDSKRDNETNLSITPGDCFKKTGVERSLGEEKEVWNLQHRRR